MVMTVAIMVTTPTTADFRVIVPKMVSTTVTRDRLCSAPTATATFSLVPPEALTLESVTTTMVASTATEISVTSTQLRAVMPTSLQATPMSVMLIRAMLTIVGAVPTMATDVPRTAMVTVTTVTIATNYGIEHQFADVKTEME